MRELALHLLDIAENSVAAKANDIEIVVVEDLKQNRLSMMVKDNGVGMDATMAAKITDPFVTSRTTRKVGLGIPLLKEAAELCNGGLQIHSTPGIGTTIKVEFQHDHIDRMPLGDLTSTFRTLVVGYPEIHWSLKYIVDQHEFTFDTKPLQDELGSISYSEPLILAYITEVLTQGIAEITPESKISVKFH